jgi:hypothetical protein
MLPTLKKLSLVFVLCFFIVISFVFSQNPNEISNGNFSIEITRMTSPDEIGGSRPRPGYRFIVMETSFTSKSPGSVALYDTDFYFSYDNMEYIANVDLMSQLESQYPGKKRPYRNIIGQPRLEIPIGEPTPTLQGLFLAFEIPSNISPILFGFRPRNNPPVIATLELQVSDTLTDKGFEIVFLITEMNGIMIVTLTPPLVETPTLTPSITPTPTLTPSITPTPTLTPLTPSVTPTFVPILNTVGIPNQMPTQLSPLDTAVINSDLLLYFNYISTWKQFSDWTAPNGQEYLILQGTVANYGDNNVTLFDTDFTISLNVNGQLIEVLPNQRLMDKIKTTNQSSENYPSPSWYAINQFVVNPNTTSGIFIAYEVPENTLRFTLNFRFSNGSSSPMEILMVNAEDGSSMGIKIDNIDLDGLRFTLDSVNSTGDFIRNNESLTRFDGCANSDPADFRYERQEVEQYTVIKSTDLLIQPIRITNNQTDIGVGITGVVGPVLANLSATQRFQDTVVEQLGRFRYFSGEQRQEIESETIEVSISVPARTAKVYSVTEENVIISFDAVIWLDGIGEVVYQFEIPGIQINYQIQDAPCP